MPEGSTGQLLFEVEFEIRIFFICVWVVYVVALTEEQDSSVGFNGATGAQRKFQEG